MYNWTVKTSHLKKNKQKFAVWQLEQAVNFGLNNEKLNKQLLKKYWTLLDLDPHKKKYLQKMLWPKKQF